MTQVRLFTVEDYFALERASDVKHEYIDGEIREMAGVEDVHDIIMINLAFYLMRLYKQGVTPCRPKGSDTRIGIDGTKYTYADLSVVCGEREYLDSVRPRTLLNPTLIVEILSKSTADYDRGDKLEFYRLVESLRQVVIIDQYSLRVEVYSRDDDAWSVETYTSPDAVITLHSISVTLTMTDIYDDVKFE